MLLAEHGGAIEADLYPDVDLLDFWRGTLSVRRLWTLIRWRLLVERGEGLEPRGGTCLARSMWGAPGDWTRLDQFMGGFVGASMPEDKKTVAWRRANQQRLKRMRTERIDVQ